MTRKQQIYMMALWTRACAAQGWPANNRALRLTAISHALGRQVSSASEIRTNAEFDRVKRHLQEAADDLAAAMETETEGRARRLRWRIRAQVDRLAQIWGDTRAAHAYLHKLLNDKFNAGRQRENWLRLEDLTAEPIADLEGLLHPSQLEQLLMTLTARASRASASAPAPE